MPVDVEEIAIGRWFIRNPRAHPILKGEGVLRGPVFEHTSHRYEGLVARLRMAGLEVLTLADQIAALPALPTLPSQPNTSLLWRELTSTNERFSRFDSTTLQWVPIDIHHHAGQARIQAYQGEPLRRRKGRGPADFYLAGVEQGQRLRLLPSNEIHALLVGYALAQWHGTRMTAPLHEAGWLLPMIEWPRPYITLLSERIGQQINDQIFIPQVSAAYAKQILARLGNVVQLAG
ncbi:MAG: hypothetical protein Fur005_17400 [Roseiflexaceae bacterium]